MISERKKGLFLSDMFFETVKLVLNIANECEVIVVPLSLSYFYLMEDEDFGDLFQNHTLDFCVGEDHYFHLFSALVLKDNFSLIQESEEKSSFTYNNVELTVKVDIYRERKDLAGGLPVNKIISRSKKSNAIYLPSYFDITLSVLWKLFHQNSIGMNVDILHRLPFSSEKDIDKVNEIIKMSEDYNIKKVVLFYLSYPNLPVYRHFKKLKIKNRLKYFILKLLLKKTIYISVRKFLVKLHLSDFTYQYVKEKIIEFVKRIYEQSTSSLLDVILKTFFSHYLISNELYQLKIFETQPSASRGHLKLDKKIEGAYLVGMTSGLWYITEDRMVQLSSVSSYGITRYNDRWYVCQHSGKYSKIISFLFNPEVGYDKVADMREECVGLFKGVHQIDVYKDKLYIVDTLSNKLIVKELNGKEFHVNPNKKVKSRVKENNHFNSVFIKDDNIYILAHNGTTQPERKSEIYVLDRESLKIKDVLPLEGRESHNIYLHKEKFLYCNSINGEIIFDSNVVFKKTDSFLRGLAVTENRFVVGGSQLAERSERKNTSCNLYFLDREWNLVNEICIDEIGQIYEIRSMGVEKGISNS